MNVTRALAVSKGPVHKKKENTNKCQKMSQEHSHHLPPSETPRRRKLVSIDSHRGDDDEDDDADVASGDFTRGGVQ
jgi:hypothetical protein